MTVGYLGRQDGSVEIPGHEAIRGSKAVIFLADGIGELRGRKLLLLDDFVMSGDGLHAVISALIGKGFDRQDIRSGAVMVTKLSIVSKKGPDFVGREARGIDFYFPWGRAE